mgnify:CR=1 FL=1|jgi:enoyl-CoA hydratase/carnithine racemase
MPLVKTDHRGHVFEISLDRTEKRNAINMPMLAELEQAFVQAERHFNENSARVVLLTAQGNNFSSGIDVEELASAPNKYGDNWKHNLFPMTDDLQRVLSRIEACSLPVIAVIQGYCIGLGLEMALACDFRFAAARTRFSLPESRLGMVPDVGGTARLVGLVGPSRAKELIMTGRSFDAEYAEQWGIVTKVAPRDDLMAAAEAFAAEIALAAPLAVSYTKRIINDMMETQRKLQIEAWAQAALFRTEDFVTAVGAALSRQTPEWKGK